MFVYIKYNNNCSTITVSKLNVSKTGLWFDRVMLLMFENEKWQKKLNVVTHKYFSHLLTYTKLFLKMFWYFTTTQRNRISLAVYQVLFLGNSIFKQLI